MMRKIREVTWWYMPIYSLKQWWCFALVVSWSLDYLHMVYFILKVHLASSLYMYYWWKGVLINVDQKGFMNW